ncbi:MAG: TonB-dependent receptor [Bacteroidales bacterium]|nr:TonB-dependent receptor [Bacteroidales bacterium]
MKRTNLEPLRLRFRRFCRAGYAAFRSMHREVTIGHLATYIADRQLTKSAVATAAMALMMPLTAAAQTDDTDEPLLLTEVSITATADSLFLTAEPAAVFTAEQIKQFSVNTISDLLSLLPGVEVRRRGADDVQGDITMRGGTFDQTVVMVNGICVTDAQTGHHNLDLPIDLSMVERVEVLSAGQVLSRGIAAFCGAVNIVVNDHYANRLQAELRGGSYGTAHAAAAATHSRGLWTTTASAAYSRSDGYMTNTDYRFGNAYVQSVRQTANDRWLIQLGGQAKGFGSQAFYSTTYPDQYEATSTATAAVANVHHFARWQLETYAYGRLHTDRFELFREGVVEPPSWYTFHNHHLSSNIGLRSRAVTEWHHFRLLAGAELKRDGIVSNVLGDTDSTLPSPYDHRAQRATASLFGGLGWHRHRTSVEATLLGSHNSQFGLDYAASATATLRANRTTNWQLSVVRSHRLPTFTDLYYTSAVHTSNPNLRSEHCTTLEAAMRWHTSRASLHADAYYRAGRNIIDWVRMAGDEKWQSLNHTKVDAVGTDIQTTLSLSNMAMIGADYSFCHVMQDAGQMVSNSAIEHLRHRATLHANITFAHHWTAKASITYKQREGTYVADDGTPTPYGDVVLIDASVERKIKIVTLYVEGQNITDSQYRDHGGVPLPGRTLMCGIRLETAPNQDIK